MEFGERRIVPSKKKQTKKSQSTNADYKKTSEKYMKRIIYVKNNRKYLKINKEFILLSTFKKQKGGGFDEHIFDDVIFNMKGSTFYSDDFKDFLEIFQDVNKQIFEIFRLNNKSEEIDNDILKLFEIINSLINNKSINSHYKDPLRILLESYKNDFEQIGISSDFFIKYTENKYYNDLYNYVNNWFEKEKKYAQQHAQQQRAQPTYLFNNIKDRVDDGALRELKPRIHYL